MDSRSNNRQSQHVLPFKGIGGKIKAFSKNTTILHKNGMEFWNLIKSSFLLSSIYGNNIMKEGRFGYNHYFPPDVNSFILKYKEIYSLTD